MRCKQTRNTQKIALPCYWKDPVILRISYTGTVTIKFVAEIPFSFADVSYNGCVQEDILRLSSAV